MTTTITTKRNPNPCQGALDNAAACLILARSSLHISQATRSAFLSIAHRLIDGQPVSVAEWNSVQYAYFATRPEVSDA